MIELLVIVGLWVGSSIAVGTAAYFKGHTAVLWFLLSMIFSPLMAVLLLLAVPGDSEKEFKESLISELAKMNRRKPS